mmetsp:Transcript_46084/g.142542  ORF Transcript_46084/g.142542 Transcript_46084/m.142542 type:complete len:257 (+) Transcript_46084:1568-2338(+)
MAPAIFSRARRAASLHAAVVALTAASLNALACLQSSSSALSAAESAPSTVRAKDPAARAAEAAAWPSKPPILPISALGPCTSSPWRQPSPRCSATHARCSRPASRPPKVPMILMTPVFKHRDTLRLWTPLLSRAHLCTALIWCRTALRVSAVARTDTWALTILSEPGLPERPDARQTLLASRSVSKKSTTRPPTAVTCFLTLTSCHLGPCTSTLCRVAICVAVAMAASVRRMYDAMADAVRKPCRMHALPSLMQAP